MASGRARGSHPVKIRTQRVNTPSDPFHLHPASGTTTVINATGPGNEEASMADLVAIIGTVACFAVARLVVHLCDRAIGPDDVTEP